MLTSDYQCRSPEATIRKGPHKGEALWLGEIYDKIIKFEGEMSIT